MHQSRDYPPTAIPYTCYLPGMFSGIHPAAELAGSRRPTNIGTVPMSHTTYTRLEAAYGMNPSCPRATERRGRRAGTPTATGPTQEGT